MAHLISHEECYLCEGDGRAFGLPCQLCKQTGWALQFHANEHNVFFENIVIEHGPALTDTYISTEELSDLLSQGLAVQPTTSHTGEERQLNPDLFTKEEEDDIFASVIERINCYDCFDSGYIGGYDSSSLAYCHCSEGEAARARNGCLRCGDVGTITVPGMGSSSYETVFCMCDAGRRLTNEVQELEAQAAQARAERHLHWVITGEEIS